MPPRQASLSVWQSAQHSRAAQEQKDNCGTDGVVIRGASSGRSSTRTNTGLQPRSPKSPCPKPPFSSLSLSRRSGSGSPDSRRFSPEPRCPQPLSLFRSRANEPHRKLLLPEPAAVKRHRVCAGLCKQTTADWTNIPTNSDTASTRSK